MKGKIGFSVICLMILAYGAYVMVFEMEYNRCDMTYMYELPRYQKVALDSRLQKRFPKYALYFYGEGTYFSNYKSTNNLDGIPVLFIPGNAGSYRQVRSMASVALRMAESLKKPFYFNYFALDFNEELSAFSGELIVRQTQFAVKCIEEIRAKFRTRPPVVVLGHSMGGVVARNLYHSAGFKAAWVDTIITQATPHTLPVFPADAVMRAVYDRLDLLWRREGRRSLANVSLVSITGGARDIQVRDGLGDVSGLAAVKSRSLSVSSTAMRQAWASADHLCAVWCKQVVMNLNRALFDMVDARTNQLSLDAARRTAVFRRHLVVAEGRGGQAGQRTRIADDDAQWMFRLHVDRFSVQREEARRPLLVKFGPFSARERLDAVVVASQVTGPWLFLCRAAGDEPCAEGEDVSAWAEEAPPVGLRRRVLLLRGRMLAAQEAAVYLVARIAATTKETELVFERYDRRQRHLSHSPGVADFLLNLPGLRSLHARVLLPSTAPGAVLYRVALPGLYHVRQGLEVRLRTLSCAATAGSVATVALRAPWDRHFVHTAVHYLANASLSLHLASSRPDERSEPATLQLLLDPTCRYRVSVHHAVHAVAAQLLRVYAPLLPAYLLLHAVAALGVQLTAAAAGRPVEGAAAVKTGVPLILPSLLMGYLLNTGPLARLPLPANDVALLQRERLWFPLLFQLLLVVSLGVFTLLCLVCRLLVAVVAAPLCGQGSRLPCRVAAHLIGLVTTLSAIYATVQLCGGVACVLLFTGQLLLTAVDTAARYRSQQAADAVQLRFSVLLLLAVVAMVKAPSLVLWLKLLSDSAFSQLPPSTEPDSLCFLLAFAFLSLARSGPGVWRRWPLVTRVVAYSALGAAVALPLFASLAFHRLEWAAALVLTCMGLAALLLKACGYAARPKND